MTKPLPSKWCPQCRDEFVHATTRCPDCDVDLVAELGPEAEAKPAPGWIEGWAGAVDEKAAEAQRLRSEWSEAEACPACATPMFPEDRECRECGLVFVEDAGG